MKNKPAILFVICIYLFGISLACVQDILNNKENLVKNGYYQTNDFRNIFTEYISSVQKLNINMKNFTSENNEEKIDGEDAASIKVQNDQEIQLLIQNLESEYKLKIEEATKNGSKATVDSLTQEKNKKIEEIKNTKAKTLEEIKLNLVKDKNQQYSELFRTVNNRSDIKYYLKDNTTSEIISNINGIQNIEQYIKNSTQYSLHFNKINNFRGTEYYSYANAIGKNYDAYFVIPKDLSENSQVMQNITYYNSIQSRLFKEIIILIISLIGAFFIIMEMKKNEKNKLFVIERLKKLYSKIPMDVAFIIILIVTAFINDFLKGRDIFKLPLRYSQLFYISILAIYVAFLYINLLRAYEIYKKDGDFICEIKETIIYKCYMVGVDSLSVKSILLKTSVIYISTLMFPVAVIGAFTGHESESKYLLAIFVMCYICVVPLYILRKIAHLNRIIKGSEEIATGNFKHVIDVRGKGKFKQLADSINSMKEGYEKSLNNQVKSERFKAELITNVSHDLKTPLTSIITYVDLLKKDGITEVEKKEFIHILDKKSQRLKVLIEDLFEASKISSGAVELEITKVNVVELLKQTLGEFNEKIISSGLDFKLTYSSSQIILNLDGKKTWRVFDNLIGNILKYSQPNTRVYIEVIETEAIVKIIMKNISAYEMEFSAEEIFERFKRGDKSRQTEGSGLGLAIAKSIVELENGLLNIEIDGDLFKAIIEFNK